MKISLLVSCGLTCVAVTLPVSRAQRSENTAFDKTIRPFFSTHCFTCHNAQLKSGNLDLESYQTAPSAAEHREVLERIAQKLVAGEMPPAGCHVHQRRT